MGSVQADEQPIRYPSGPSGIIRFAFVYILSVKHLTSFLFLPRLSNFFHVILLQID